MQFEIYKPFVKRAWRVESPELFPEIIEKAFQLAESGQPGPVLVDVPMDIFSKEVDVARFDRLSHNTKTLVKPDLDADAAAQIVRALGEARKPVLCRRRRRVGEGHRRIESLRRSHGHSGGAQPDGQGRAAGRSPADARHDRFLGHQVHQREVPHRRLGAGARHALQGSRLAAPGSRNTRSRFRRRSSSTSTSSRAKSAAIIRPRSARSRTSSRRSRR